MKLPTVDESVMDAIEARTKCLQGVLEDAYCDLKIRIRNLEAENADLQAQIKELSNHKREHHE